jgi:hypothetical protein
MREFVSDDGKKKNFRWLKDGERWCEGYGVRVSDGVRVSEKAKAK